MTCDRCVHGEDTDEGVCYACVPKLEREADQRGYARGVELAAMRAKAMWHKSAPGELEHAHWIASAILALLPGGKEE